MKLLLALLFCLNAYAGVFYYGSGEAVNLENVIGYNKNGQKIISGESADPSVGGYVAEMGSLYMRNTGEVWIKTAIAPDTAWERTAIISDLVIDSIPVATYTTIQDYVDQISNAGWISGGAVTDNLDGTVDVAAGTGMIRDANDDNAPLLSFDWAASAGVALTDNSENYIYIDYNAGAPVVAVTTTGSTVKDNENDAFELTEIYREGTELHTTPHRQKASNVGKYAQQYLYDAYGLQRTTGLILGETGTRNITTTAGTVWLKLDQSTISAMDTSAADTFDRYYRDGIGGWTKQAAQTDWNNTQYDDGTGVLASLVVNRYSVQYFYIEADGGLSCLFGWNEYVSLAGAEADIPPSSLPNRLEDHAILIGRLIFQASGAVSTSIESAFAQTFGSTGVASHSDLSSLTADDHINYPFMAGRSGGQTIYGSPDASEEITISGSSNATTGFTHLEPLGGKVTIGTAIADDGNYLDIEETNAGNLRVRVRNLSPTGNTQFEVRNDVAGHNMAIGLLGSGVGVGVIAAGSPAIIAQTSESMNIMNDSNDPIRFLTDVTDSMTLASTVKFQIGGDGTATFNFNNDDADFFINKNTAGTAYTYDAGLDYHDFESPVSINGPPATDTIFDVNSTTASSHPCNTMTTVERDLIGSPKTGSCIFNSTSAQWEQYDGAAWGAIGSGSLPSFEDGKILASTASASKWINDLESYEVIDTFDAEDDLVVNWTTVNSTLTITTTGSVIGDDEYNWASVGLTSTLQSASIPLDPALRDEWAVLTLPMKTTEAVVVDVWDVTNAASLVSSTEIGATADIIKLKFLTEPTTANIAILFSIPAGAVSFPVAVFNQAVVSAAKIAEDNDIIDSIGEVSYFTRTSDFNGWISALANSIGSAASTADYNAAKYEELYTYIWNLSGLQVATSVGAAVKGFTLITAGGVKGTSASADFNANNVILIDLEDEFLRGSGTTSAGTHVDDAVEDHNHNILVNNSVTSSANVPAGNFISGTSSPSLFNSTNNATTLNTASVTGVQGATASTETRPDNTVLNPFIRYKNDTVAQTVSTGGGSSGALGDADTISLIKAANIELADLDLSGNNADFDGGGTIDGTVSLSTTAADIILDTQVIKYVAGASSQDDYFGYTVDVPQGLRGRTLGFQKEYKTGGSALDGDFRFAIKIKDGALAGKVTYFDMLAYVPTDDNARPATYNTFIPSDCTQIEIGWQNTDPTSGIILIVDNILVTSKPLPVVELYNVSDWEGYTPTITGFGTPSSVDIYWRRDGDVMELRGNFTCGTPTATEARISLPDSQVSDSEIDTLDIAGSLISSTIGTNSRYTLIEPSVGYLTIGQQDSARAALVKQNGSIVGAASRIMSFTARIPIEGWTSETSAVVHSDTGTVNDFVTNIPSSGTTITSEGASSISAMVWAGNTVTLTLNTDQFTVIPGVQFTLNPTSYTASATTITATYAAPTAFTIAVSSQNADYKNPNAYAVTPLTETCYLKDVKAPSAGGGNSSAGMNIRVLNTPSGDTSWCSLSTNQFTLAPGKYELSSSVPGYQVGGHQAYIYDVTNTADVELGTSEIANTGITISNRSLIETIVDISVPTVYEIRHYTTAATTNGLGYPAITGKNNVFTTVKIKRLLGR